MKKTLMAFVLFCVSLACAFPLLANPVVSDPSYSVELVASNLGFACGVAIGPAGDIFVSGYEGPIFKINKVTYAVTTYDFGFIYGMNLAFDSAGTLFALSGDGNPRVLNKVLSFNPPTSSYFSQGYHTVGLAVGPGGYIYLGNTGDGTISKVGPSGGIAETILTGLPGVRGVGFDLAGNLYIAVSDTGDILKATPPYTAASVVANLGPGRATYLEVDSSGVLYVSDAATASIHKIDGGIITLFASGFGGDHPPSNYGPVGLKFDSAGNLFVADSGKIWKFSYTPPPDVSGCVKLQGVPPSPGVEVQLKQKKQDTQSTTTDANGCYQFDNVVPGKPFDITIKGLVVD